jgi:hypothetical protein
MKFYHHFSVAPLEFLCSSLSWIWGAMNWKKNFTKMESRRKQNFISTPLKREMMAASYAEEHSALR